MNARLPLILPAAAALAMISGCGGSAPAPVVGCGAGCPAVTYTATLSPASLSYSATVGPTFSSAPQVVTLSNTGTGALTLSSIALGGTDAGSFTIDNSASTDQCGSTLAAGASCTVAPVFYGATGSGTYTATLTFTDNAATSPQTVTLTAAALGSPTLANTVDCSVAASLCADTFTGAFTTADSQLPTDPIATGGFHGYADPSMRKDPNSSTIYYAYSWAKSLADGTHVVDLHLAQSSDSGKTFNEVGSLYESAVSMQHSSTAYASSNDSSTETVDLLPIPLTGSDTGQTLWVQAHQSYLVKPTAGIYDQLNATNLIIVTAVQLTTPSSSGAAVALLALGSPATPEARLAAVSTDPSRNPTQNLAALSTATSKCGNWGQPALWYQAQTLYLALECTEITGTGQVDANELAHYLYTTTPTGSDASQWTWAYAGEFLTGAEAATLGTTAAENATYKFFTEPEFVQNKDGQLFVVATPSVFSPAGSQQPVIQYGCRTIPVTLLSTTGITLDTDTTTGALVTTTKLTEDDLYTSPNEGPAACTYDPAAINGVVIGRKYEDLQSSSPPLGFYIYPVNSGLNP